MTDTPGPTPEEQVELERLQQFVRPYLPAQVTEDIEFLGDSDDDDGEVWAITYEEPSDSGVTLMLFVMRQQPKWQWSWHLSGGEGDRWGIRDPEPTDVRLGEILDAMARGSIVVTRGRSGTSVSILGPNGKPVCEETKRAGLGGLFKGPGAETTVTYRHWRAGP